MRKLPLLLVLVLLVGACSDGDPEVTTEGVQPTTGVTAPFSPPPSVAPATTAARVTTPPTTKATPRIGSTITLKGMRSGERLDVTVVKVVNPAPAGMFIGPRVGKFIAIQLRLVNSGSSVYSDRPTSGSTLVDQQNKQFGAGLSASTAGPGFDVGLTIPPGETLLGYLTFDVPSTTEAVSFQFALNSGFGPETGEWKLT